MRSAVVRLQVKPTRRVNRTTSKNATHAAKILERSYHLVNLSPEEGQECLNLTTGRARPFLHFEHSHFDLGICLMLVACNLMLPPNCGSYFSAGP